MIVNYYTAGLYPAGRDARNAVGRCAVLLLLFYVVHISVSVAIIAIYIAVNGMGFSLGHVMSV